MRVNAIDTPHFEADVAAVVCDGLHLLNLPKAESVEQVRAAAAALEAAEQANGVMRPVRLMLNVESPKGLRQAAAMAQAHARVAGLQLGFGDLFEPLGIARRDVANVHAAMFAMRLAAGEAGVFAYDSAFADVKDADGYLAEADMARRLGYLGKSCIHPSQVALAHQVFRPSESRDRARAARGRSGTRRAGPRRGRLPGRRPHGGRTFRARRRGHPGRRAAARPAAGALSAHRSSFNRTNKPETTDMTIQRPFIPSFARRRTAAALLSLLGACRHLRQRDGAGSLAFATHHHRRALSGRRLQRRVRAGRGPPSVRGAGASRC